MANSCITIAGTNGNAYVREDWRRAIKTRHTSTKAGIRQAAKAARRKANRIARRYAGIMPKGVKQYTLAEIAALDQ